MNERVVLLTLVCRSRWFSSMSTEELKLYLLLLVSAVRIGKEGQIAWEVLRRGLGESLTAEKITRLAKALSQYGLAKVHVTCSTEVGERQRQRATPVVGFTVFGLERLTGPRSRISRRGRAISGSHKPKGEK